MAVERRLLSRSEAATEELAARLGRVLPAGTVVALTGELGSGKTCFVRGLARGLGIEEGVASPTYTLMQAHEGGRLPLYHFDAWMEGREKAWLAEGGGEWLRGEGVAVVEWAGRVEAWLPRPRLQVALAHAGPEERTLVLRVVAGDPGEADPLERLLADLDRPDGIDPRDPDSGPDEEKTPGP